MITIPRAELASELSLLVQIAGQKNVIPALSTVRMEFQSGVVSLLASNGDTALFTEVPGEGDDWQGCIPAQQLHDLMRLAGKTDKVIFTPQGAQVQIAWGRSKHRLPVTEFAQFPDVSPSVASSSSLTVKMGDLTAALERVLPCASRDENTKYMLRGVKLEAKGNRLKLIGTNTHRLGVVTIPAEGELDVFVPLGAATLLAKLKAEEVTIRHDQSRVSFSSGPRMLIARLLTGTFPSWSGIMPESLPLSGTLSTEELIGALRRAEVTREEIFKTGVGRILLGVVLVFGKEELVIDTKHGVRGRSEESVGVSSNLNGDLIYMGINPDYLIDFLTLAGSTTEWALKDGNNVLKLTDGSNFEYVVVPTAL